jgi:hypothetical protein
VEQNRSAHLVAWMDGTYAWTRNTDLLSASQNQATALNHREAATLANRPTDPRWLRIGHKESRA